jgi:hypothetical protein
MARARRRAQRSEKHWLTELLNRPNGDLGDFCAELKQLQAEGQKLAFAYELPKVKKRIRQLEFDQQDLILPATKNKRIMNTYKTFHALEVAINAKLKPYASSPNLFFDIQTNGWGSTESWQDEEHPQDYMAIRFLVHLVRTGKLEKLRRCQKCQIWYLAHSKNQEYCTTSCRKKHNSQDTSFKAQRKAYMKVYRAKDKQRRLKGVSTR